MSLLGIGASLVGGLLGSKGAGDAAAAQEAAAAQQVAFARETRNLTREDMAPFLDTGVSANNALAYMMGLGPAPVYGANDLSVERVTTQPGRYIERDAPTPIGRDPFEFGQRASKQWVGPKFGYRVDGRTFGTQEEADEYARANATGGVTFQSPVTAPRDLTVDDFEASPGYNFRLQQGLEAATGGAAARHGLASGAALEARERFAQDYGSAEYGNFYNRKASEYNNYVNRLSGLAGAGQSAAAGQANANALASQQTIQAIGNTGNAQAAGAIGQTNAWSGALDNALGAWQYNKILDRIGNV